MTKQHVLRIQGAYYIATGLWPLVSMRSFEAVTGPKVDKWLVRMVGLLAATIGFTLLVGAKRNDQVENATYILATTSALSFSSIDIVYSLRRRISLIYLGDAVGEVIALATLIRISD